MKSLREKGLEEAEKQRLLDEIHQQPDVKKVFTICEIFMTIDWISNIAFLILFGYGIWTSNFDIISDISSILYVLLDAIGGYVVGIIFIVLKIVLDRLKKHFRSKLQILEDARLAELNTAKAEGTYQEGRKPKLSYRVYRAIRTWTTILACMALLVIVVIKIL